MESAPSRTAMFAAVSRGLFRLETASPWVLDDVLALVLVGPVWQQLRDQIDPLFPGPARREARAAVCTRSRYSEDRLAAGAFTQYVILGAGLDARSSAAITGFDTHMILEPCLRRIPVSEPDTRS